MEIERSSNPEERGREHEARSDEDLTMDLEENDGRGLRRALSNGPLKCKTP